jgi:hypothetical protein
MTTERMNRNVVEELFDLTKEVPEELEIQENPENLFHMIKLDFRRTIFLK